jgi:polyhydroxyalkanoate synthesis regulator phasin
MVASSEKQTRGHVMKRTKQLLAAGAIASVLTIGAAGVVTAAGVSGHGPASVLSDLVSDGTLTQAQADKVEKAFEQNREEHQKQREARRTQMQALVAKTLGISVADVEQARKDGKSLAELAGDKRDALVTAMVAAINANIDKDVASGKLSAQEAAQLKSETQARVEERVDQAGPMGPMGGPGRGHRGEGAAGAPEGTPESA